PQETTLKGGVTASLPHDSARRHVTGEAVYIDDMPEPEGMVHVYVGLSERAHARLVDVDLSKVRTAPGVLAVFTAADIPGDNDVSPQHLHDEPLLARDRVEFAGQPIFMVAARTRLEARAAVRLAAITYDDLPAV
ncbi:xanthine dehydrogenase molybdopterin binding subunit, partial [Klebsiella pneumoniae]